MQLELVHRNVLIPAAIRVGSGGGMPALSVPSKDKLVKAAITDNHIARRLEMLRDLVSAESVP
jgi:hypothetical protein